MVHFQCWMRPFLTPHVLFCSSPIVFSNLLQTEYKSPITPTFLSHRPRALKMAHLKGCCKFTAYTKNPKKKTVQGFTSFSHLFLRPVRADKVEVVDLEGDPLARVWRVVRPAQDEVVERSRPGLPCLAWGVGERLLVSVHIDIQTWERYRIGGRVCEWLT